MEKIYRKSYLAWANMLDRCRRPAHKYYHRYGGRGISVCDEWFDFNVFYVWSLGAGIKPGLSLDRTDNDGNYEPSNCRWVTQKEQTRNSSHTKWITFRGETLIQTDWAKRIGIADSTLLNRLRKWPLEEALTRPHSSGCRDFETNKRKRGE